jgi:hypothetical protein
VRKFRRKAGIFAAKPRLLRYIDLIGGALLRVCVVVPGDFTLKEHKYRIGQSVYFASRPIGHMIANSTYEVVKLLPSDGADYQYRIKNPKEAFERVARESQLEYMA